jgi:hypothetical protein
MSEFHFLFMSLVFKIRDLSTAPVRFLEEAKITPGARVLDYGCGPGSYSTAASQDILHSARCNCDAPKS